MPEIHCFSIERLMGSWFPLHDNKHGRIRPLVPCQIVGQNFVRSRHNLPRKTYGCEIWDHSLNRTCAAQAKF
jgi:hypothetical protein